MLAATIPPGKQRIWGINGTLQLPGEFSGTAHGYPRQASWHEGRTAPAAISARVRRPAKIDQVLRLSQRHISLCRRLGIAPSASGASTRRKVGPCRFAVSGAGKSILAVGWVKNTEFPGKRFRPRDPMRLAIRSKNRKIESTSLFRGCIPVCRFSVTDLAARAQGFGISLGSGFPGKPPGGWHPAHPTCRIMIRLGR